MAFISISTFLFSFCAHVLIVCSHGLQGTGRATISKSHLLDQAARVRRTLPVVIQQVTGAESLSTSSSTLDDNNDNTTDSTNGKYPNKKAPTTTLENYSSSKTLLYPTYYQNRNKKRGFSNWLIKDRIMIGQYPGQTPEKDGSSLSCAEQHIESLIMQSNIRLFCSLQSEIPPQDDYKAWCEDHNGKVYLPDGGRRDFPNFFGHYEPLVQNAYSKMMKKNGGSEGGDDNDNDVPPSFIHAPIIDLSTPSSSSLYTTLSNLLDVLENRPNHAIYIHCWGGRGRAGLVGACLLSLIFPELDSLQVLDWVQRGYDTRYGAEDMPFGLKQSPQTLPQREFVRDFVCDMHL